MGVSSSANFALNVPLAVVEFPRGLFEHYYPSLQLILSHPSFEAFSICQQIRCRDECMILECFVLFSPFFLDPSGKEVPFSSMLRLILFLL
jgi:hypothetical protein